MRPAHCNNPPELHHLSVRFLNFTSFQILRSFMSRYTNTFLKSKILTLVSVNNPKMVKTLGRVFMGRFGSNYKLWRLLGSIIRIALSKEFYWSEFILTANAKKTLLGWWTHRWSLHVSLVVFTFQTEERNRLFTADAEETELVFYVPFTLLEHRSRQRTKTRKRNKSRKLRGGKPSTEWVRRALWMLGWPAY